MQRWTGIVLAAALVVLAGACSGSGGGGALDTGGLPRYVPTYVPGGLPLVEVAALPLPTEGEPYQQRVLTWTDDPAEVPGPGSRIVELGITGGVATGTTAWAGSTGRLGGFDQPRVEAGDGWHVHAWSEGPDVQLMLSAVGLDDDEFAAVRASVVPGDGAEVAVSPPPGFRQVFDLAWDGGTERVGEHGFLPVFSHPAEPGYAQVFSGPELGDGSASLAVRQVGPEAMWPAAVPEFRSEVAFVTVGGRTAIQRNLAPDPRDAAALAEMERSDPHAAALFRRVYQLVTLQWWDADGVGFTIMGPDAAEALRMAEGLEVVDGEAWEAFVTSATGMPVTTAPRPPPSPRPTTSIPVGPRPSPTTPRPGG